MYVDKHTVYDFSPVRLYYLPRDAMLARYIPSLCVCLSDTLRHCIKMAKPRITQIMPWIAPGL